MTESLKRAMITLDSGRGRGAAEEQEEWNSHLREDGIERRPCLVAGVGLYPGRDGGRRGGRDERRGRAGEGMGADRAPDSPLQSRQAPGRAISNSTGRPGPEQDQLVRSLDRSGPVESRVIMARV